MSKLTIGSFIICCVFILNSCNGTFVSKKVLESEDFTFVHAGKVQKLLIELKEIKTITRSNGFFTSRRSGPIGKSSTFDYAIYASVNDGKQFQEIFEFPCAKDVDFNNFINGIVVKRSKKRDHFMVYHEEKIVGIFHSFKGVTFLAAYPMEQNFPYNNANELNLNKLNRARVDLKNHILGDNPLLISDNDLASILVKLPPKDELNYEFSNSIASSTVLQSEAAFHKVINHCKKDRNWLKNALETLKNRKDLLGKAQYISKLHLLGGLKELTKEDAFQLELFKSNSDLTYFQARLDNNKIILNEDLKVKLKNLLLNKITNPCLLAEKEIAHTSNYFDFLQKLGEKGGFKIFFEKYKNSNCVSKTLHDYNSEFLFGQEKLGETDKRKWVNFVVENFNVLSSFDRSWNYSTLEKHLTCSQKRSLLSKYRKDVDRFESKEIPSCN
jgi:hypothetical protein